MGKSGGSIRSGGGIVGFRESEKALQLEVRYSGSVAPRGGYTSSMVRDVSGTTKVWVPKAQIERRNLSEWISSQKRGEVEAFITSKRFMNAQVTHLDMSFHDARGAEVKVKATKKETQYKKERERKRSDALAKAKAERSQLISQAKANGYKAHDRMSTATLTQMARGTYKSSRERNEERKRNRVLRIPKF